MVQFEDEDDRDGVSEGLQEVGVLVSRFAIRAHVTDETIERLAAGKAATGLVCVEVDGEPFPEKQWDDFVLVVVDAWISNSMTLAGGSIEVENRFMDGPWSLRVRREPGSAEVRVGVFREGRCVSPCATVPYRRLLAILRGTARSLLNELAERGVTRGEELDRLRGSLASLVALERQRP